MGPIFFLAPDYCGGYGWLFPKGAVANVGLGIVAEARRSLKPMLTALYEKLADQHRIGTKTFALTGGAISVGGRLRSVGWLERTAVLLAGDAAGLTNPVTGAGIASAAQSGALAGRAAADLLVVAPQRSTVTRKNSATFSMRRLVGRCGGGVKCCDCYAGGRRPDARTLSEGWIASPHYWAA